MDVCYHVNYVGFFQPVFRKWFWKVSSNNFLICTRLSDAEKRENIVCEMKYECFQLNMQLDRMILYKKYKAYFFRTLIILFLSSIFSKYDESMCVSYEFWIDYI